MRERIVIGNWKMHGSLSDNARLLDAVREGTRATGATVAVCVPFPYLVQARDALAGSPLAWGAQDVCEFDRGAYTGEVAPGMLAELGCRYVLVGHSERRRRFGEADGEIGRKLAAAVRHRLTPVLCVGETLAERDAQRTEAVVAHQLDAAIDAAGPEVLARAVIAYEPVWAIGTGKSASAAEAQAVHGFIRRRLAAVSGGAGVPILYGGSVKAGNAQELFAMPDIDGALVGGASLAAGEFVGICAAAEPRAAVPL